LSIAEVLIQEHQADALVLGCTEFPLMIQESDVSIKVLNSMQIHMQAIIRKLTEE